MISETKATIRRDLLDIKNSIHYNIKIVNILGKLCPFGVYIVGKISRESSDVVKE